MPLFYFVLHLTLIHLLAVIVCYAERRGALDVRVAESRRLSVHAAAGLGLSLPVIYLLWVVVVVSLYPVCAWFAWVKQRRRDWWLSYL